MFRDRDDRGEKAENEPEPTAGRESTIVCPRCSATLTDSKQAIDVEGKHRHDFVNPSGMAFRLRIFREAPGCAPFGEADTFFSWFAGHAWRVITCAHCHAHVGWRFEGRAREGIPLSSWSVASVFHGLIEDRIAEGA